MQFQVLFTVLPSAAAALLIARYRAVRGTTFVAPWLWTIVSLSLLAATALFLQSSIGDSGNGAAWRFVSASSTLCPGIALLGAKRPQNRAWQWIVASLWLILVLPALQQLLMGRSDSFELHPARTWFMTGLLLFCFANVAVSRKWPAVLLAACGIVFLLLPFMLPTRNFAAQNQTWGTAAISVAAMLACIRFPRSAQTSSLDRLWLDFRDMFGLVWSLRFMEQLNAVARTNAWNMRLTWSGFCHRDGNQTSNLPPEQIRILQSTLNNLLRRFVSAEWIAERLGTEMQRVPEQPPER